MKKFKIICFVRIFNGSEIKVFASGQAIPEASLGVFNARPRTPALRAAAKNGFTL